MYRARWQIELAFKRLKSILNMDQLNTRDPGLARSWILAHLIAAVMLEGVAGVLPDTPTLGPSTPMPPILGPLALGPLALGPLALGPSLPSHPRGATCAF
jgi:Transposase DDE domain